MKKTCNINVAGFPFTIDDDAYALLDNYLITIENAFAAEEDTRELAADIESRIAELLQERTSAGSSIITALDVEEVIARVGQPEEIIADDDSISITTDNCGEPDRTTGTIATPPPYVAPVKKKLYRDPADAMVGGVCAGLAWYLNADPTFVRLITLIITLLSVATGGIAYLVMWIVVPEARTPLERMQMMGKQPTVENIGKTVTDTFREDSQQPWSQTHPDSSFGGTLASLIGNFTRVLIIIGLIIGVPLLVALVIGLIGCVFTLIMFGTSFGTSLFGGEIPEWYAEAGSIPVYGVVCGIGSILTLGIPLFILVRMGLKKNGAQLSKGVRNTLLALWIIGFITAAVSTGRIISLAQEEQHFHRNVIIDEEGIDVDNGRIRIDESGIRINRKRSETEAAAEETAEGDSVATEATVAPVDSI